MTMQDAVKALREKQAKKRESAKNLFQSIISAPIIVLVETPMIQGVPFLGGN